MRASYDCQIVGDDPAACLIACELAEQGFHTFLRTDGESLVPAVAHTLLPASQETSLALRRWPLPDSFFSRPESPQRKLIATGDDVTNATVTYLVDVADFRQWFLDRAQQAGVELLPGELPLPAATITVRGAGSPAGPVVWGHYGDVRCESQTAWQFASRTGARLWLLPLDAERTSVGVCLPPTTKWGNDLRTVWEDELVACPPLIERLYDAQLLGPLRIHRQDNDANPLSQTTYKPHLVASPLDFSWEALFDASETACAIAASLRQTPVY